MQAHQRSKPGNRTSAARSNFDANCGQPGRGTDWYVGYFAWYRTCSRPGRRFQPS